MDITFWQTDRICILLPLILHIKSKTDKKNYIFMLCKTFICTSIHVMDPKKCRCFYSVINQLMITPCLKTHSARSIVGYGGFRPSSHKFFCFFLDFVIKIFNSSYKKPQEPQQWLPKKNFAVFKKKNWKKQNSVCKKIRVEKNIIKKQNGKIPPDTVKKSKLKWSPGPRILKLKLKK